MADGGSPHDRFISATGDVSFMLSVGRYLIRNFLLFVGDLDNVGPGEEEDFRLVTVNGDTTVRGADQDKGVVFILRERGREREREEGMGKGKVPPYQSTPRNKENGGKRKAGSCLMTGTVGTLAN